MQSWGTAADEIHLTIGDLGSGFELEATRNRRGLGLIGMDERLKLVKETLTIDSQPNLGTTIHARVPVSSDNNSVHDERESVR